MAGYAKNIQLTLLPNNRIQVIDDGRGIPIEKHPQTKKSTLETVMTILHAGGKLGGKAYQVSGGLHGVGISVVNALSVYLSAEVCRDGIQYQQEYLGQLVDGLGQWFHPDLVNKTTTAEEVNIVSEMRDYYLGVDIARMGEDLSVFAIIDGTDKEKLIHIKTFITKKTLTTATTREIIRLESIYKFRQILIDDGGMGVGVFDGLYEHRPTRRKVVGLNNASRSIEYDIDKPRVKRLLKEDMYNNLLRLMEQGKIKLLNDPEIAHSLRSIQFEHTDSGKLRIFGRYTHIAEGLIRAAWCVKDKSLKPWVIAI